MAFPSRDAYERFIYSLPGTHSEVQSSTLHLYTNSPTTCFVRGSIRFRNGLELCVFEYLDFADGELLDCRYALLRGEEPVRWYDSQPHPEIPELASTFPHHLHEPPDIKHNRKPAPGISFTAPNLPTLIADCIALGESPTAGPPRTLRERDARYSDLLQHTEVRKMATITLSDILDDLRAADQILRKFEQRYWISSTDFYELYSHGLLDDGQHREDFSEWAGYYKIKLKREAALQQLSQQRLERLRSQATAGTIELYPKEPVLELA